MAEWILTSSILILTVCILRLLLKGHISARLHYVLWTLVLIRLLVPFSFPSQTSITNAIPPAPELEAAITYVGYDPADLPDLAMPEPDLSLPPVQQQSQYEQALKQYNSEMDAAKEASGIAITPKLILVSLWILGMALMATALLVSNLRFYKRLRRTRKITDAPGVRLHVYTSTIAPGSCLFGLFRPAIYLAEDLEEPQRSHVLAHEQTHYAHKDHIWSLLRCVCLVIHWYNPLVWVAANLSERDAELACDEATIRRLGEDARAEYGRTLIAMTSTKKGSFLTATTMTTGKRTLKERIRHIALHPRTRLITLILVVLGLIAAAVIAFAGSVREEPGAPATEPTVQAPEEPVHYANLIYHNGEYFRFHQELGGPVSQLDTPTQYLGEISEYVPSGQLPARELASNGFPEGTPVYEPDYNMLAAENAQNQPDGLNVEVVFPAELFVEYETPHSLSTYVFRRIDAEEAAKPMLTMEALRWILAKSPIVWDDFQGFSGTDVSFEDYIMEYTLAGSGYHLKVRSHLRTTVDSLLLIHYDTGDSADLLETDLDTFLEKEKVPVTEPTEQAVQTITDSAGRAVRALLRSEKPTGNEYFSELTLVLEINGTQWNFSLGEFERRLHKTGEITLTDMDKDGQTECIVWCMASVNGGTVFQVYTIGANEPSLLADLNEMDLGLEVTASENYILSIHNTDKSLMRSLDFAALVDPQKNPNSYDKNGKFLYSGTPFYRPVYTHALRDPGNGTTVIDCTRTVAYSASMNLSYTIALVSGALVVIELTDLVSS